MSSLSISHSSRVPSQSVPGNLRELPQEQGRLPRKEATRLEEADLSNGRHGAEHVRSYWQSLASIAALADSSDLVTFRPSPVVLVIFAFASICNRNHGTARLFRSSSAQMRSLQLCGLPCRALGALGAAQRGFLREVLEKPQLLQAQGACSQDLRRQNRQCLPLFILTSHASHFISHCVSHCDSHCLATPFCRHLQTFADTCTPCRPTGTGKPRFVGRPKRLAPQRGDLRRAFHVRVQEPLAGPFDSVTSPCQK